MSHETPEQSSDHSGEYKELFIATVNDYLNQLRTEPYLPDAYLQRTRQQLKDTEIPLEDEKEAVACANELIRRIEKVTQYLRALNELEMMQLSSIGHLEGLVEKASYYYDDEKKRARAIDQYKKSIDVLNEQLSQTIEERKDVEKTLAE